MIMTITVDEMIERFNGFREFRTVYDIGAHNGRFTKRYNVKFARAKFFCFEANKDKPSTIGDTKWFRTVLSDKDNKIVNFYEKKIGYNTGDSYYKQTWAYENVNPTKISTKTLDTMIKENNIPLPDFIKIDTQGSELDILSASGDALENCKLILCEVPAIGAIYNEGAPSHEEYMNFFEMAGFKKYKIIKDIHGQERTEIVQHDIVYYK